MRSRHTTTFRTATDHHHTMSQTPLTHEPSEDDSRLSSYTSSDHSANIDQQLKPRNFYARIAVIYHFMLEGILVAIFSSFLPSLQAKLALSDSLLGTAVLFVYLFTVLATPISAYLMKLIGSRFTCYLGAMTFGLSLPLIPLAPSFVTLTVVNSVFGLTMGIMDVSMNSCGVMTEIVSNQTLMGGFHGRYVFEV
jgi:uncharacterized oligopeptide transporter (OPT) family protein